MNFEIYDGDLITAFENRDVNILAHCCNRQNTFSSGIAKSIKERLPWAYEADCKWNGEGNISRAIKDGNAIYNLYGQEFYGQGKQVNYGRLSQALHEMAMELKYCPGHVIGIPYYMASDRAGGDWKVVLELVKWYLRNYEVKIYKLEK